MSLSPRDLRLVRGGVVPYASLARLRTRLNRVVAFPTFTSWSERMEDARGFPVGEPKSGHVKAFFELRARGRRRITTPGHEDEILIESFAPFVLLRIEQREGRQLLVMADL